MQAFLLSLMYRLLEVVMSELKTRLKALRIQNRASLRTSEKLAISKQIWAIQDQIEALNDSNN
jgi:hypothetical protein